MTREQAEKLEKLAQAKQDAIARFSLAEVEVDITTAEFREFLQSLITETASPAPAPPKRRGPKPGTKRIIPMTAGDKPQGEWQQQVDRTRSISSPAEFQEDPRKESYLQKLERLPWDKEKRAAWMKVNHGTNEHMCALLDAEIEKLRTAEEPINAMADTIPF